VFRYVWHLASINEIYINISLCIFNNTCYKEYFQIRFFNRSFRFLSVSCEIISELLNDLDKHFNLFPSSKTLKFCWFCAIVNKRKDIKINRTSLVFTSTERLSSDCARNIFNVYVLWNSLLVLMSAICM